MRTLGSGFFARKVVADEDDELQLREKKTFWRGGFGARGFGRSSTVSRASPRAAAAAADDDGTAASDGSRPERLKATGFAPRAPSKKLATFLVPRVEPGSAEAVLFGGVPPQKAPDPPAPPRARKDRASRTPTEMVAEVQKRRRKKKKRLVLLRAHAANFDKERGAPPAPKKIDKPAQLPADDAQEAGGGDLGAWIADLQAAARIGLEEDDDAPSGGDATEVASALDTADMIEALAADQSALSGPKKKGGTRLARF